MVPLVLLKQMENREKLEQHQYLVLAADLEDLVPHNCRIPVETRRHRVAQVMEAVPGDSAPGDSVPPIYPPVEKHRREPQVADLVHMVLAILANGKTPDSRTQ
jgi:hypothetical protein